MNGTATFGAEFDGLVALVTGGASGIGRATVLALVARGAAVASLDLVAGEPGAGVLDLRCDVTDDDSVSTAVGSVVDQLGGLDIVVSNAGAGARGSVEDTSDADWQRVFDVNLFGTVRLCRAALPHLRRSSAPAIVITGSVAGWTGLQQRAAYAASKGALHALTLAMAADYVGSGIRVNAVAPGTADTPWVQRLLAAAEDPEGERIRLERRQPHGRLVSAAEVAHAICSLATPAAGSTTGVILAVDGGSHSLLLAR